MCRLRTCLPAGEDGADPGGGRGRVLRPGHRGFSRPHSAEEQEQVPGTSCYMPAVGFCIYQYLCLVKFAWDLMQVAQKQHY